MVLEVNERNLMLGQALMADTAHFELVLRNANDFMTDAMGWLSIILWP